MYMPQEYGYFRKILSETRVDNCDLISPPAPRAVMEAAAKAVRSIPGCTSMGSMRMSCYTAAGGIPPLTEQWLSVF